VPEAKAEPVERIEYMKPFDIYAGAAWMPLLSLYGKNPFYAGEPSLSGAAVRLGIVYSKTAVINPGLEFAASWQNCRSDSDYQRAHSLAMNVNILFQKWTPNNRIALNFRLGAGLYMLLEVEDRQVSVISRHTADINLGLSFYWLILKHFYFETGIDYAHIFTEDNSGCLRPWIGLGLRF